MKADKIIKNAKIFTADKTQPQATALAVKDGKFVMPGIIDSHVHVTMGAGYEFADIGEHEGFSYNLPQEVYFGGKKMN